jgi:hypothetical protein
MPAPDADTSPGCGLLIVYFCADSDKKKCAVRCR